MVVDPDDLDTMVRTLSGECRGEHLNGQIAVAYVIRNRAEWTPPAWWGHTIGQVCRKRHQFSCWNDGEANASDLAHMMALDPSSTEYQALEGVCLDAIHGNVPDPTYGATHYKVTGTKASWDVSVAHLAPRQIGHHTFYKLGPI